MEGREAVYDGADALNRTQKLKISSHDQPLDSIFASAPSNSFLGSRKMVSFGAVDGVKRPPNSDFQSFDQEDNGDEYLEEYFNQSEKKRRLSVDQVQFLEKHFEAENKLEPERKIQLAKELGLQPRQIAVWFQNRRARWKTKQLETDYEALYARYENLKTDYDNLLKENEKLKTEVVHRKNNGLARDIGKASSQICATQETPDTTPKEAIADMISEDEEPKVSAVAFKNEEQSSVKSDVTHVGNPILTDGIHFSPLKSGDSSHFFEPDQSDLSQNGEDHSLNEELLLPAYMFSKVEDAYCHPPANGFLVEDHPFGFWSY